MIGPVAIVTENDDFDAEIYRSLLELVLGATVERWQTEMRFSGRQSIEKRLKPFLDAAEARDVRHALLAVDNDGGSSRHPEHRDDHVPAVQADNPDGCSECWLRSVVPRFWQEGGRRQCIVVPVQTIETWLLCLRGDALEPSPEAVFHRRVLKTRFFGKPTPSLGKRTALALAQIGKAGALGKLRERPSFVRFETDALSWR